MNEQRMKNTDVEGSVDDAPVDMGVGAKMVCTHPKCRVIHNGYHRTKDLQSYFVSSRCRKHGLDLHNTSRRQFLALMESLKDTEPERYEQWRKTEAGYQEKIAIHDDRLVSMGLLPPKGTA